MRHILIVEDEIALLRNITTFFGSFPQEFQVFSASNAEDGFDLLLKKNIHVLLTDIRLPGMDGLTLLQKGIQLDPKLRVIVMTAFSSPDLRQQALHGGALRFIEKPLDLNELLDMVRELADTDQGWKGTMEGLDIFDFIQIMVLCQKSKTLELRDHENNGLLIFKRGELTYASTNNCKGKDAFFEIVTWQGGQIRELASAPQEARDSNIHQSATFLMMEAARIRDERQHETGPTEGQQIEENQTEQKELEMGIKEHLNELNEVEGFQAAAVFTAQGQMLESVSVKKMDMKAIGMYANNALLNSQKATDHMGVGRGNMVQIRAPKANIILRCHNEATDFAASKEGRAHVHCAVVMDPEGNTGMASFLLDKIVGKLAEELR